MGTGVHFPQERETQKIHLWKLRELGPVEAGATVVAGTPTAEGAKIVEGYSQGGSSEQSWGKLWGKITQQFRVHPHGAEVPEYTFITELLSPGCSSAAAAT